MVKFNFLQASQQTNYAWSGVSQSQEGNVWARFSQILSKAKPRLIHHVLFGFDGVVVQPTEFFNH